MIALITFLVALDSAAPSNTAAPSTPPSASPAAIGLPKDPEQLARFEFAEFASGKIDQSHFSQPIPQTAIDQLHQVLPSLGAIKSMTLIKKADTPAGPGYAYKVVCEKGALIEQFAVKDGTITSIWFAPAQ